MTISHVKQSPFLGFAGFGGGATSLLIRLIQEAIGGYQIEKSLRFNDPDAPSLTRTFSTGNTRTWTWAAWVKRSKTGVQHNLFSAYVDGNNQGYLVLESDDMIAFDQRIGGTWSNATKTNRLFRDTSAWFHITFVFDSTNALEADRIRLFINGERYTGTWNDAPNCTQNLEGKYNSAVEHQIGRGQANSNYLDGYLADVHFIDGLALSPAAFGSFDSTGVWNPKEFALPAPNDNKTWSGMVSGTALTGYAFTSGFDGDTTTGMEADSDTYATFTPTSPITANSEIRINIYMRGSTSSTNYDLIVNGTSEFNEAHAVTGTNDQAWYTLKDRTLTSLRFGEDNDSAKWMRIYAIEVDGVILIDGQTDPTTRNNPNNNTTWSASKTTSANTSTSNDTLAFNGTLADGATLSASSQANNSVDYAFTGITGVTLVELYISGIGGNGEIYGRYNATNGTASGNLAGKAAGWYTVYNGSAITLTSVGMILNANSTSGGSSDYVRAFRVDGHVLINAAVDNSFHLKFNDVSSNAALGFNAFNDDYSASLVDVGGPILKTDVLGQTLTSGEHTDTNTPEFAWPGNNLTDTSGKTITGTGFLGMKLIPADTGTAIGDMTMNLGLAGAFDGEYGGTNPQSYKKGARKDPSSGANIGKDWGSGNTKTITGYKIWGVDSYGIAGNTSGKYGKFQGSNDNSNWTDLHTISEVAYGTSTWEVSALQPRHAINSGITTSTAYRYHRFLFEGDNNGGTISELEFYEAGTHAGNAFTSYDSGSAQSKFYSSTTAFDGATDGLTTAAHSDFDFAGDFCIEGWVNKASDTNKQIICDGRSGTSTGYFLWVNDSGVLKLSLDSDESSEVIAGSTNIANGTWNHIAVTRSGSGSNNVKMFLNGTKIGEATNTSSLAGDGFYLGVQQQGSSMNRFHGWLQDFRVYKGVAKYTANFTLPVSNVNFTVNNLEATTYDTFAPAGPIYKTADKNDGFSDDNLKQYLRFACPCNEGDGTLDMNDYHATIKGSGSNHVVTASGWATHSASSTTGWGHSGNNNSNQATAQSSDFELSGSDDFCLEFWTYVPSSGITLHARLFNFGDDSTNNIGASIYGSGSIYPNVLGGYMGLSGNYFTDNSFLDAWYHWAFTRENGTLRLFGNGVLKASQSNTVAMGSSYNTMRISGANYLTNIKFHDIRYYIGAAKYTDAFTPSRAIGQVTQDSLVDTPTNYGEDTGAGGEVRGNYCTYDAVDNPSALSLSQGNLAVKGGSALGMVLGTMSMPAGGKFYWEVAIQSDSATAGECYAGIANRMDGRFAQGDTNLSDYSVQLKISGEPYFYTAGASSQESIGTWTAGETLGLAFDVDAGTLKYYRNNVLKYTHTSIPTTITWQPAFGAGTSASAYHHTNFGVRAFKYTAPSGYKSLCTQNLDNLFDGEDSENNPSKYFDVRLFTGNDTTDGSKKIKYNFSPDLYWQKALSSAYHHRFFDRIRGQGSLKTDASSATNTDANSTLTTFDSDGVSIENTNDELGNSDGVRYVAWAWDAGAAATSIPTAGSLNPSASWVNTVAGFNMLSYEGGGSATTIGHSLGVTPELIMLKNIDEDRNWNIYHKDSHATAPEDWTLYLDGANGADEGSQWFNDTAPTSTVFSVGSSANVSGNGSTHLAYLWVSIPGYSKVGSYVATASAGSPFVHTGFKPKWLLIKNAVDGIFKGWAIIDSARDYGKAILADSNAIEGTDYYVDINSNGFTIQVSSSTVLNNANNDTYVYMAFAEHPFKVSRAG